MPGMPMARGIEQTRNSGNLKSRQNILETYRGSSGWASRLRKNKQKAKRMKRNRVGLKPGSGLRSPEPKSSADEGKRFKKAESLASPTPQDSISVHLSQESTPQKSLMAPAPPPAPSKQSSSIGPHAKNQNRVFGEPLIWTGSPENGFDHSKSAHADSEGESSPTPQDTTYVHLSQESTPHKSPRVGELFCLPQVVPSFHFRSIAFFCSSRCPSVAHCGPCG